MKLKMLSDFNLFGRAYRATSHEIWVSVKLLVVVTVCFAVVLFFAESTTNDGYTFWDALVWTFVKYVEDPADIVSAPVTVVGKVVGTLVGVLGIAIFAVPAGLIGSGLMEAMDENKREKELDEYYRRVRKAFRRGANKSLRTYLNSMPDKGGEALSRLNFVPQRISAARLQVRQGMDMKDIFEVCRKYPDLCLKNLAEATENTADDLFVVEMFPKNRSYGCCIGRGSKVTIVCPTGYSDLGIGWYGYYLAKLGGFNYVCKSIEADTDELDSFYNMSDEPLCNKRTRAEYDKRNMEELKVLDMKEHMRAEYLADIHALAGARDSWVIILADHLKNGENTFDLHFASALNDGSGQTDKDTAPYKALYEALATMAADQFGMVCTPQSVRYPLLKKNVAYRLQREGLQGNIFVLRPSAQLVNFEDNRLLVALRMAQVISQQLDGNKGIGENDIADFAAPGYGFMETSADV